MKGIVLLLAICCIAGCSHVISKEALNTVDQSVTFGKLKAAPEAYVGANVLVGGIITKVTNGKEGAEMEIVDTPLDPSGEPQDTYRTEGRFLAETPGFLDPMVYKSGRYVTLVGQVRGKKTAPLDEIEYTYPVISIREIYLWKTEEQAAPGYPYYDPYYWGYGPAPYWYYRPWGPVFRPW